MADTQLILTSVLNFIHRSKPLSPTLFTAVPKSPCYRTIPHHQQRLCIRMDSGAATDEGERAKSTSNSERDGGIEWSGYKAVRSVERTVIWVR